MTPIEGMTKFDFCLRSLQVFWPLQTNPTQAISAVLQTGQEHMLLPEHSVGGTLPFSYRSLLNYFVKMREPRLQGTMNKSEKEDLGNERE